MKKSHWLLLTLLVIVITGLSIWLTLKPESDTDSVAVTKPHFRLAIVSIVEIEPIVELREGFREVFDSSQFAQNYLVHVSDFNAQGDSGLINQIADKVAADKPDLVYVLGTPIAQAIQNRAPQVLLVQGAVTDPIEAGLADTWEGSGRKYVATSDLPPVEKQIALIEELTPKVKRLGLIYNPGEINSVAVVSRLRSAISRRGLDWQLVERPIANTADVAAAVQSMTGKIDALYLPPDNTAHASIPLIGQFAAENNIPFYATVENALNEGALAVLSLDFRQVGRESAELALKILNGQDPAKTPILVNQNPTITISSVKAKRLGIDVSRFRSQTNVVIKE